MLENHLGIMEHTLRSQASVCFIIDLSTFCWATRLSILNFGLIIHSSDTVCGLVHSSFMCMYDEERTGGQKTDQPNGVVLMSLVA